MKLVKKSRVKSGASRRSSIIIKRDSHTNDVLTRGAAPFDNWFVRDMSLRRPTNIWPARERRVSVITARIAQVVGVRPDAEVDGSLCSAPTRCVVGIFPLKKSPRRRAKGCNGVKGAQISAVDYEMRKSKVLWPRRSTSNMFLAQCKDMSHVAHLQDQLRSHRRSSSSSFHLFSVVFYRESLEARTPRRVLP